jgi:hypothetical protein
MKLRASALISGAAFLVALVAPATASAHGLGGIRDLPIPGWLFLFGGATVLIVSFLALGVLWREPRLDASSGKPLPGWMQWLVFAAVIRVAVRTLSLVLFVLVWSAAAFGTDRPSQNFAPTFIYVLFWVGIPILSVLFGNVWSVLDPWRTVADAVASLSARVGVRRSVSKYPKWLGVWPAVLLLFSFTVLELVYRDPARPRVLALGILLYSVVTWTGMVAFGRRDWGLNGDGFRVYFGFLSRISLLGTQTVAGRKQAVLRQPLSGLAEIDRRPGVVAFFATMLGTVAFDGLSRSRWWLDRIYDIQASISSPAAADRVIMLVNFSGLVLTVLFVAGVYTGAVKIAERIAGESFSGVFVFSLVPIAFVYALAHYFSLFVVQGQFAIPLASDPYGKGWDLFGTDNFQPKLDVLSPNATWYVAVGALVLGHVCGLIVAHDRAVSESPSAEVAVRTQYAMLALMILYTIGGMWLLTIG